VVLDPHDRAALDRLRSDQEHRDWIELRRRAYWRAAGKVATVVSALVVAAAAIAQLLHL
jgi:hypothetical protein